jgi:hypothetical protein
VIDQAGRTLGLSVGFYGSAYPQVWTSNGAILTFDNNPATTDALPLINTLYYKLANCAGPAYVSYAVLPFQTAIIVDAPVTGAQIYVPNAGARETFTAQSSRSTGGCTNGATSVTNGYTVRQAGTVPAVEKPLMIQPAS